MLLDDLLTDDGPKPKRPVKLDDLLQGAPSAVRLDDLLGPEKAPAAPVAHPELAPIVFNDRDLLAAANEVMPTRPVSLPPALLRPSPAPSPSAVPLHREYGREYGGLAITPEGRARGAGFAKAIGVDLPVGIAHFLSTPVRAAFAPETPEEAKNPLIQATKMARAGMSPGAIAQDVATAERRAAEGAPTPSSVAGEAARGLVTQGFDAMRAAMPGPTPGNYVYDYLTGAHTANDVIDAERNAILAQTPESQARAVTNLGLLGLLTAVGGKDEPGVAGTTPEAPSGAPAPRAVEEAPRAPVEPPPSPQAVPRTFTQRAADLLRQGADKLDPSQVEAMRQAETESRIDPRTELGNARAFAESQAEPLPAGHGWLAFDLRGLKATNDYGGRAAGDALIKEMGDAGRAGAEESGIELRHVSTPAGDELFARGPVPALEQMRERVHELLPERDIPGTPFKTGVRSGIGETPTAAADAANAAKATETNRFIRPELGGTVPPPNQFARLPTAEIHMDPARFQYKQLGEAGVGGELKGVQKFNEKLAGVISVWRDPADGQVYVVNGHHRLDLAQRLGHPEMNVQFLDAPDAQSARAQGALINIAEGRGTATDAAKFFRDTDSGPADLEREGVPLRGPVARDGLALSRLAPDLFDQVATEQVPQGWGVAIGQMLDDPVLQREAFKAVKGSGKRLTNAEVTEVARQVRDAGINETTQETLFGTETERHGLYVQRAQLAAQLQKRLAADKRLFGFVSKEGRASELSRAGETQIDVGAAKDIADQSARVQEVFDRLYTRSGPIADVVNEGARRIANGEKGPAVVADLYPRIADAVQREVGRTAEEHLPEGGGERPVPPGTRSVADEVAEEPGRVRDSQDVAQQGMFASEPLGSPARRATPERPALELTPESEGPAQGSFLSDREGTSAARNLRETEAAARGELEVLRQKFAAAKDPETRATLATQIAEREKLVNRDQPISQEEMRTRAAAEPSAPTSPEQEEFFVSAGGSGPRRSAAVRGGPETPGPEPKPTTVAPKVNGLADAIKRVFAPASRTAEAGEAAHIIRQRAAEMARAEEQAVHALRDFARSFDREPDATRLDFIDRMEAGRAQATPELTKAAASLRVLLDNARDAVRALGTGKLEHVIENYFPHIWEDPQQAQSVLSRLLSKRPLEGAKSFLKERTLPTTAEGIAAGLKPITTNPVDLALLKVREMNRYIFSQKVLTDLKSHGLLQFVDSFSKSPDGFRLIDDRVSTVYGPPETMVKEGYDVLVRQGLQKVIADLGGLTHERKAQIGGKRLGYASSKGDFMATRAGSLEAVTMHELGHILDFRYKLWDKLTEPAPRETHTFTRGAQKGTSVERATKQGPETVAARKQMHEELRALADLRFEGQEAPPGYVDYVRNRYEKVANAIAALLYAPERMEAVAPTVKARLTEFLRNDPKLRPLLDIKPSLVWDTAEHAQGLPGFPVVGHWYAPESVATVVNNYLSPGLSRNPLFDLYRRTGNLLNMAQLGMSAFHLGFTSVDAAVSKVALGVEQMFGGRLGAAIKSFAHSPLAPVENILRGDRVLREYLTPGSAPEMARIVEGLVQAGGRARMDRFYRIGAVEQFREAWRKALHEPGTPIERVGRAAEVGRHTVPAIVDALSKPIMEVIVPRQKLGVFADLARAEIERLGPTAKPDEVRVAMAKAWDSVDNRMGQLVYDNLFWNRAVKDLGMASVRSLGWNLGTARELGGGAVDLAKQPLAKLRGERMELTHRGAYVVALPMAVGLAGGVLHYLLTGQAPQEIKDYFFPKTGRRNPDGTEERVQLPSYMKDVYAYADAPWQTVKHKINPAPSALFDMLENRDFYGNMIRNPDDPMVQQAEQSVEYAASQFEPFGIRQFRDAESRGQSNVTSALNFVGVTPAPRRFTRSRAENRMVELLGRRGLETLTPEQVEQRDATRKMQRDLRRDRSQGAQEVVGALHQGDLTERQATGLLTGAYKDPEAQRFKQLTGTEALEVYRLGTPAERQQWWPLLIAKIENAAKNGDHLAVEMFMRTKPNTLPRTQDVTTGATP